MSDLCNPLKVARGRPVVDAEGLRFEILPTLSNLHLPSVPNVAGNIQQYRPIEAETPNGPLILQGLDEFGTIQQGFPVLVTDPEEIRDPEALVLAMETLTRMQTCVACWACGGDGVEVILKSKTWNCPEGIVDNEVEFEGFGAGGAGGGNAPQACGGGAGGNYAERTVSVTPGRLYFVRVGTDAAGNGGSGMAGEDSRFVGDATECLATGGAGGESGSVGGDGGSGSSSGCSGSTVAAGESGGDRDANTSGAGGAGANGGAGGAGYTGYGRARGGAVPGGGGGGASGHTDGGTGGHGRVVLEHGGPDSPETFTRSGYWRCPPAVYTVLVKAWSQGGCGGGNRPLPGGGGAGGAWTTKAGIPVTPGADYAIVVGENNWGTGTDGASGGDTSFATTAAVAKGGAGGEANGGPGGSGSSAGCVGDTVHAGGDGNRSPILGGGGAGGCLAVRADIPITPGQPYSYHVATATPGTTSDGAAGDDSWFMGDSGTQCLAKGGAGGLAGAGGTGVGGDGSTDDCVGDDIAAGGDGGDGTNAASGVGGAAADDESATPIYDAGPGGNAVASCDPGDSGRTYGAGGSGAGHGPGGNGAQGVIVLYHAGASSPEVLSTPGDGVWTAPADAGSVVTARCRGGGGAGGGLASIYGGGGGGSADTYGDGSDSDGQAGGGLTSGSEVARAGSGAGGNGAANVGSGLTGQQFGGGGGGAGDSGLGGRGAAGAAILRYAADGTLPTARRPDVPTRTKLAATFSGFPGTCCGGAINGNTVDLLTCSSGSLSRGTYPCDTCGSTGDTLAAWNGAGELGWPGGDCALFPDTFASALIWALHAEVICVSTGETPPYECEAWLLVSGGYSANKYEYLDHGQRGECCLSTDGFFTVCQSFFGCIQLTEFEQLCGKFSVDVPVYCTVIEDYCATCYGTVHLEGVA